MEIPQKCKDIIKANIKKMALDPNKIYSGENITFYFLMSQECNANCPYCYQPKQFRQDLRLSKKIIDDSMDFILNNFREERVKFCLFGGEPTLNWDMVTYVVDSFPTLKFIVMTNGILMYERSDVREWMKKHDYHLNVSLSIEPLKKRLGPDYIEKLKPSFDVLKSCKGDVNFVITDPDEPGLYEAVKAMLDYGVPTVRVNAARHSENLVTKRDSYIGLFKKIADYVYFADMPMWNRSGWDTAFKGNLFKKYKGMPLKDVPPTMCGCGYIYLAIDYRGDIYPCDWFANFPEFKVGSIYEGFTDTARLFYEMKEWIDCLYEDCKQCTVADDIRLCPRAMCLAENYQNHGNPLKPSRLHCEANRIEQEIYKYIVEGVIKRGYDKILVEGFSRK